jgi:4-amino-4-deoxy-L-arabinose transferase-like glycosyltransferase
MHHGHLYAGQVYANTTIFSANGIPASFYLRALATKVPVVVLGAVTAGLIEATRRRRERGFALLNLWFALFLIGHSLTAGKFLRYGLPLFTAIDIFAAIGVVAGIRWLLRKRWLSPMTRVTVSAATLVVCLGGPFLALHSARPFYSLFRNAIGERVAPAGATFTEETYEYGVREAIQSIARIAEPGAVIVSDAPGTVAYYVEHSQRRDLRVRSLSAEGLAPASSSSFVIVQNEHVSFENRNVIADLRRSLTPWREFYAGDALAAQVFRIPRS